MDVIIFGSGESKSQFMDQLPLFTISCNMARPYADLIFAIDAPIIESILTGHVKGFETQSIFTTMPNYDAFDSSKRILLIDDRRFFTGQGLGTGTIAIGCALKLGFKRIFLSGFEFTKGGGGTIKLYDVASTDDFQRIYRIGEALPNLPIPQITEDEFLRNV